MSLNTLERKLLNALEYHAWAYVEEMDTGHLKKICGECGKEHDKKHKKRCLFGQAIASAKKKEKGGI